MESTQNYYERPPFLKTLSWFDGVFALLLAGGCAYAFALYGDYMDAYEKGILVLTAGSFIALGWLWKPLRTFTLVVATLSLFGITQYHGELARADKAFFLKYLFSSQSAIMWMSALFVMATAGYWFGMAARSDFANRVSATITWCASAMGLVGLMVRWHESYLIGADVGHIPLSKLYELFIFFYLINSLLYLY